MTKTKTTAQKEKATKKVVKTVKPLYTVDLTGAETIDDVNLAFAVAKIKANQPLNYSDIEAIRWDAQLEAAEAMASICAVMFPTICSYTCEYCKPKKVGFFKRMWNWITRKK